MIFNRWIRSKSKHSDDTFGIVTDFHSHILPSLDDGSRSLEESLQMIEGLHQLGFNRFICTPHIRTEIFPNTPQTIHQAHAKLKAHTSHLNIEILVAAEYMIDDQFTRLISNGTLITFGNNYVLIELSHIANNNNLLHHIFELQIAGYKVVLAHPERYEYLTLDTLSQLKDRNVIFQLNGAALIGAYGNNIRKRAETLIDQTWIELIGSDLHAARDISKYAQVSSTRHYRKLLNSDKLINDII